MTIEYHRVIPLELYLKVYWAHFFIIIVITTCFPTRANKVKVMSEGEVQFCSTGWNQACRGAENGEEGEREFYHRGTCCFTIPAERTS